MTSVISRHSGRAGVRARGWRRPASYATLSPGASPGLRSAGHSPSAARRTPMTSMITRSTSSDVDDGPAIAELHRLHGVQRAAFLADPYPGAGARAASLGALAGMTMSHRAEIRAAMSPDFGVHPELFTDLVEVLGV